MQHLSYRVEWRGAEARKEWFCMTASCWRPRHIFFADGCWSEEEMILYDGELLQTPSYIFWLTASETRNWLCLCDGRFLQQPSGKNMWRVLKRERAEICVTAIRSDPVIKLSLTRVEARKGNFYMTAASPSHEIESRCTYEDCGRKSE